MRMTIQRKTIMEEIERMCSHPTAEEVYRAVRKRLPDISLGTVYRNLRGLSEAGLIQALDHLGTKNHFDHRTHRHYHVHCIYCDRVADAGIDSLDIMELPDNTPCGFKILNADVNLQGVCPDCMDEHMRKQEEDS